MSLPFCWSGHVFSPPRSNVSKVTSIICSISKCHLRTLLILSGNCCGKKEGLCRNCWGTCLEGVVPHTFPSSLSPFVSLPHPENLSKICKEVLKTNQRFFSFKWSWGALPGCYWALLLNTARTTEPGFSWITTHAGRMQYYVIPHNTFECIPIMQYFAQFCKVLQYHTIQGSLTMCILRTSFFFI